MDKSIKERAKINAKKAIEYVCGRRVGEPDYLTNLFIQMATEQRKIDAIKFSIAFCDHVCSFEKRVECDNRKQTCTMLATFLKQAMEEE